MIDTQPVVLVDDLNEDRLNHYRNSRYLAVDCETMGLQTRRDRLCVVQMCDEHGVTTLIQTRNYTAPRLKEIMERPSIEKIFHFGRFDVAALKQWLEIDVTPVFCTKIASKIASTYTDRHGLKNLSQELLGIELNKEQQSSNWASKKLSDEQVQYASNDVIYLGEL
ncbi:MAG: ribonuclease D, partial [Magnetococcales bacterium]|nr:ribonuclease D [Magnetococcales bacterium]